MRSTFFAAVVLSSAVLSPAADISPPATQPAASPGCCAMMPDPKPKVMACCDAMMAPKAGAPATTNPTTAPSGGHVH